jgi:hypothetical protein
MDTFQIQTENEADKLGKETSKYTKREEETSHLHLQGRSRVT